MVAAQKKTTRKAKKVAPKKKATRKAAPKTRAPRAAKAPPAVREMHSVIAKGSSVGKVAFGGLGWLLTAVSVAVMIFKGNNADAATGQQPVAGAPPLNPNPPIGPGPLPDTTKPKQTDQQRLDLEFRRAKTAEIPRDILGGAKLHTKEPIGVIIFETSSINGKEYAYVLEQHANLPKGDGGVSVYIHR